MMRFALVLIFTLSFTSAFCQKGYKQDLNGVASLTFPDTPRLNLSNGTKVYIATEGDTVLMATAAPLNKFLSIFGSSLNNNFYTGVIIGATRQAHGKLFYRKSIKLNNIEGIEFAYTARFDSLKYYCYHQAYNINNSLVFYGYWTRDSLKSDDKGMRDFFGTLAIEKNPNKTTGEKNAWFRVGEVIGVIFVIAIIVGIGIGIVFLIKRMSK